MFERNLKMQFKNKDLACLKNNILNFLSGKNQIVIILGLVGLILISISGFFKKVDTQKPKVQTTTMETKQEKLQQSLENIISAIEGAGNSKVLVTFENSSETVYATEEKKNKEASEDKSDGETTRRKESDDCEKKYITVKDNDGTEHALAVTEIEPKVKGVIIICQGGDNPIIKQRITEAVTTALNITSKRVCVTKSS